MPVEIRGLIDGRAVAPHAAGLGGRGNRGGEGDHRIDVVDPATEHVVAQLREADADEVGAAVAAARRAFDSGPWPRMNTSERSALLRRIHDTIQAHADELTQLEVLHTGLPLASVRWQVQRAAHNFMMFAEVASTLSGQTYSQHPGYQCTVTREPRGVAALIAPWNAPLALGSMRVATCIAFGNTCVLKPSEVTPLSMQRFVQLLHEAGLPPGVVNLVNGRGHVTGAALVAHPGIDMVAFTGGTATGRAIAAAAGQNLKPVMLELGGKSANIVFDSCDFEAALDGSLLGIYANNGQMCLAGSRILVQRGVADRFIAAFVARARRIRVGHPLDPATELGPLAYRAHYERVLGYVDIARSEGAELLCGGARAPGFERGFYMQPTAVLVNDNRARVCQEEIFGPFATIQVFDTLEQALAIANHSPFGLVSYVWSQNLDEVMRASREIRAGVVWVNTPLVRELRSHFGGLKDSGFGGDGAIASPEFFTQAKSTLVPLAPVPMARLGAA
jgi:acyl-CoA reductase-like NAD-dependent aldehyde dehydrogenase